MTTTPDIATMHPQDMRDAWLLRPAAVEFKKAHGFESLRVIDSVVIWSWRPAKISSHTLASKVAVHRNGGRLFVVVSDPTEVETRRDVSPRNPLRSWAQLEQLVRMLTDGEPMVPRVVPKVVSPASPFADPGPPHPPWVEVVASTWAVS